MSRGIVRLCPLRSGWITTDDLNNIQKLFLNVGYSKGLFFHINSGLQKKRSLHLIQPDLDVSTYDLGIMAICQTEIKVAALGY